MSFCSSQIILPTLRNAIIQLFIMQLKTFPTVDSRLITLVFVGFLGSFPLLYTGEMIPLAQSDGKTPF